MKKLHCLEECSFNKFVIIHSQGMKYNKLVYQGKSPRLTLQTETVIESVKAIIIKFIFVNQDDAKIVSRKIQIGII
jgi:hypothetical protein